MLNNRKVSITHPLANVLSISTGEGAYGGENTSEIAFFHNREWVVDPIGEFAEYHDGSTSDTAVYGWVPNAKIDAFIEKYSA
jgi:hypothetical protein